VFLEIHDPTYLYAPYSGAGKTACDVAAEAKYLQQKPAEQLASDAT